MFTIIGCGNLTRRDEGVGVIVAQRLAMHLRAYPVIGVQAFDCATAGFEVMRRAEGSRALCILDASHGNAEPGAIHQLDANVVRSAQLPRVSSHEFRWDQALDQGRALYPETFPTDVRVIMIEAADTEHGMGLSPLVEDAAQKLYEQLLDLCTIYQANTRAR